MNALISKYDVRAEIEHEIECIEREIDQVTRW